MKKLLLIVIALLAVSSLSQAQTKKFSASVLGGLFVPTGDLGDVFSTGGNAGVDVNYMITPQITVYANTTYNFISPKNTTFTNTSFSILEATAGPRFFFGNTPTKFFAELGLGSYTYKVSYTSGGVTTDQSKSYFGFNGGFGVQHPVSRSVNIVGKVKYHSFRINDNGSSSSSSGNYFGIYAGANFAF